MTPTRAELEDALRNADAAGASEDARALADALAAMDATPMAAVAPPPGFLSRLSGNYMKTVDEGVSGMRSGVEQMTSPDASILSRLGGAGMAAMGALQYGYSPISAASKTIAGDPTRIAARSLGAPEWAQEMAGTGSELVSEIVSGSALVKGTKALPDLGVMLGRVIPEAVSTAKSLFPIGRRNMAEPVATLSSRALDDAAETGYGAPSALTTKTPGAERAEKIIYDDMISAGWTPERIQAKLRQLGPGATLADLAPFSGRAEVVAQYPSGAKEASRTLIPRERRMKSDLLTAVDKTLTPENFYKSIDDLKAIRSEEGKALRAEAMKDMDSVDYKIRAKALATSPLIQSLMTTPEFQAGLRQGAKIINLESARTLVPIPKSESWYYGKNFDDPDLQIIEAPTLRMMDAAKQGFDQMLKPFENKFTGKLENLGPYEVEIDKTRRALVEEMRRLDPKYAKYLDKWADSSEMISAIERGKDVLKNDPEVTAKMLAKISPDNREYTQIGLAKYMRDLIDKNPNQALKLFDRGRSEKNMQLVFGSKQAYNLFKQQALRKMAQHRTMQSALRNSATVRRELGAAGLEEETSDVIPEAVGAGLDLALGNKAGFMRRAGKWVANRISSKPDPKTADELAPVLFSDDPILQQRVIQRMRQRSGLNIEHNPNDRIIRGGR